MFTQNNTEEKERKIYEIKKEQEENSKEMIETEISVFSGIISIILLVLTFYRVYVWITDFTWRNFFIYLFCTALFVSHCEFSKELNGDSEE